MEDKKPQALITSNEEALQADLLEQPLRLTPTGKISHAKTRVYTQRYRKQWEEMPDFKGWLTSVPYQPTRAFCTYCKKNLHAHRLSLLKHTCTMKHQRSALMHEDEEKSKRAAASKAGLQEINETIENPDNFNIETEENEEEIEYVVERLDMDEEEEEEDEEEEEEEDVEDSQDKFTDETIGHDEEEDEEVELEDENEEDMKPMLKRIKMEDSEEQHQDTLAQAMAHVHGEYLDEVEEQANVQMEMVVESEDQNSQEMQMVSILADGEDASNDATSEPSKETNDNTSRPEHKNEKKSGIKGEKAARKSEEGIVVACPLPVLGTTYHINTSGSNTIGVLQPVSTIPTQSKTITLTTGGKVVTLTGGTFTPGAQYVLNKVKGKYPTIMMAEKKTSTPNNQIGEAAKSVAPKSAVEQIANTASTSQQPTKKLLLKPVKSPNAKKPRISTHVMDSTKGLPVGGLQVSLYKLMDGRWTFLNESNTAPNGRCMDLVDNNKINFTAGRYKMHFDVDKYFTLRRIETMYPFIEIVFDVKNPTGHYHIPVLLSPFGYTTYRGSER